MTLIPTGKIVVTSIRGGAAINYMCHYVLRHIIVATSSTTAIGREKWETNVESIDTWSTIAESVDTWTEIAA